MILCRPISTEVITSISCYKALHSKIDMLLYCTGRWLQLLRNVCLVNSILAFGLHTHVVLIQIVIVKGISFNFCFLYQNLIVRLNS